MFTVYDTKWLRSTCTQSWVSYGNNTCLYRAQVSYGNIVHLQNRQYHKVHLQNCQYHMAT